MESGKAAALVGSVLGIFLAAFAVYLGGAAPALYGGDSGELIASAAALGISHAPGYPLHALLAKAFGAALPWGGFAYKVNLFSAVVSALTAALLFRFLLLRLGGRTPALAGAVFYAALPIVWDQAQTAEVFALNNLFAVGLLLAWPFWDPPARVSGAMLRRLCLWAFLYGAALANHLTAVLLFPGFAWHFGGTMTAVTESRWWKKWLLPAVFAAAGATLYLYLPLRAAKHPPVNFGDPHTVRRFVDVVTRREFGSLELHPAAVPFRTFETARQQAGAFLRQTGGVAGWGLLAAGLAGIALRRRKAWWLFWGAAGPLFFWMSNLSPFNTLAQWRMERFALLPALFLCAGAAGLLAWLLERRRPRIAALLLAGLLAEQAALHRPWFRWNMAFRDLGRNVAASLPEGSALLIDGLFFDEPTSCVANRFLVERQRPDVSVIYRPGTMFGLSYGEDILEIPRAARGRRRAEKEAELWRTLDRPLAALALSGEALPAFAAPWNVNGLTYQAASAPRVEATYVRRADAYPEDYPSRLILVHYPYFAAKAAFEAVDVEALERTSNAAVMLGRRMEWLRSNLGSLWSRHSAGMGVGPALRRAATEFESAAAIDPYFPTAYFGVGYVRVREEKWLEAAEAFERACRLKPDWAESFYMLGLAYSSAGRADLARRPWERFLELEPASQLAPAVREALKR